MKTAIIPFIDIPPLEPASEFFATMKKQGTRVEIDSAPWSDRFPCKPEARAWVAASEDCLWVLFSVTEECVKAEYMNLNDPVSRDSCAEIFIADADNGGYWNFEFNCIGTMLAAHRNERRVNVRRLTPDMAGQITVVTSLAREKIDPTPVATRWELGVGLPFRLLGYERRPRELRVNLYKCADDSEQRHYLSWSPVGTPAPDFHRREYFGRFILEAPKTSGE